MSSLSTGFTECFLNTFCLILSLVKTVCKSTKLSLKIWLKMNPTESETKQTKPDYICKFANFISKPESIFITFSLLPSLSSFALRANFTIANCDFRITLYLLILWLMIQCWPISYDLFLHPFFKQLPFLHCKFFFNQQFWLRWRPLSFQPPRPYCPKTQ